jgi:hypothetical protein
MRKLMLHGIMFSLGLFLVVELFFRFVLPAAEWPRGVILDSGIRRFDSESFSTGRYSYGRYCKGGYYYSINEQGWNSIFDYKETEERQQPMVAILGDSYLEGFYSDVSMHIDAYLTEMFDDSVSFYTFAMSGGILSQYIALMKYEIEQYNPDAYIIFINSSDILASIRELGSRHPYFFQYSLDSAGVYSELKPVAESRSHLKDILLRSAFVRYLRSNAGVSIFGGGLTDENANLEPTNPQSGDADDYSELNASAAFLLSELNSFGKPVLIVADCPKNWIYAGTEEEVFEDVLALRESIDEFPNVTMLELSEYYKAEYEMMHREFSVPDNPHWNAYANRIVARTIAPFLPELLSDE